MGALPLILSLTSCFALGVVLLLWPSRTARVVTRAAILVAAIGALGLLLAQDVQVPLPVEWLPEQAPAALTVTGSARYLVVGVLAWAAISLWQHGDLSPPALSGRARGLMLITSALAIFAVTIDHFLLRYVALELVALVTASCLAIGLADYRSARLLWRAYLPWRLGGSALLLSILVLERETGTFNIAGALAGALELPPWPRLVAGGGAALAAWVKLGLPPFHVWLLDGARAPRVLWPAGNVLPLLGAYLLYRFHDVLALPGVWPSLILLTGVAVAGGLRWRRADRTLAGPSGLAREWWPVWHGALAVPALALGLGSWYLATFVPLRLALGAWSWHQDAQTTAERGMPKGRASVPPARLLRLGATLAARLDVWLETVWTVHLPRWVANVAAPGMYRLERGLEALLQRVVEGVGAFSAHVQRWHTGRLRSNLRWVVLALSGVVLAAFLVSRY